LAKVILHLYFLFDNLKSVNVLTFKAYNIPDILLDTYYPFGLKM